MTVNKTDVRQDCYWSLDPERELRFSSTDQYTDAFRELFFESVRCRLRSHSKVGSTLSGGLDSSSIVCAARHLLARNEQVLDTFSLIFPDLPDRDLQKIDERPYMGAVVAMGGLAAHYVRGDHMSPLDEIDTVLFHQDEAVFAPNLYLHWGMYRQAHGHGVRVLLDGIDGDTTVSHGLGYLAELTRSGRWFSLVKEAAAVARRSPRTIGTAEVVWDYGCAPLLPPACVQRVNSLFPRAPLEQSPPSIINPAFAKRLGLSSENGQSSETFKPRARIGRVQHWEGLTSGLLPYVLETADKAAAVFSIEPRYPFCDRRLVEFCLAVPTNLKLHNGWTRMILRRAMAGILPREVQWRSSKANLSPNFQKKLLDSHRSMLERIVLEDSAAIEPYVDMRKLRDVYSRYLKHRSASDALMLYSVSTLAGWLKLLDQTIVRSGTGARAPLETNVRSFKHSPGNFQILS
jgi:asparagine synthase (glutamine-hydrolysing)